MLDLTCTEVWQIVASRGAGALLDAYIGLLSRVGAKHNLIGVGLNQDRIRDELVGESVFSFLVAGEVPRFGDIGSGAGLPGIVWGIMQAERWGRANACLFEPREKRRAFLSMVSQALNLGLEIRPERAEEIQEIFLIVTLRAVFAPNELVAKVAAITGQRMILSGSDTKPTEVLGWTVEVGGRYRRHDGVVRTVWVAERG